MDAWSAAIARGDLQVAWAISDAVLAGRPGRPDDPDLPYHLRWVWDGRGFDGRQVLVRCYHGLGDTLQFVRYVPALRARAASVTLEAQPELVPLLEGFPGVDRLVAFDVAHPLPPAECDIEVMELGHALRVGACWPGAYVRGPAYLALASGRKESPRLLGDGLRGRGARRRQAVSMVRAVVPGEPLPPAPSKGRGNPDEVQPIATCARAGDWDPDRSVPLEMLLRAIGRRRVTLLHRDPDDPADPLADIRATAAILAAAPLIITVDTMIAHLAGALGRPTWLLLKANPDWRWLEPGRISRWYPVTRLYRQRDPGDWRAPLAEIAADLSRLP